MQFGIRLPNSGPLATRENLVLVAETAERLGFHSVWVHDHIIWGEEEHRGHLSAGSAEAIDSYQKPNFFESVTSIAYIAGRTKRIRLGIAVLILPLRNPLIVGKQLANIDVLSEGRLILGVAPGAPNITKQEFDALGVAYHERGKITDDYIRALKVIWKDDSATYAGEYTKFNNIKIFPKPVQHNLRVLIGGGERGISERAVRRVAELGDGWIPAYLLPQEIKQGIDMIKRSAMAFGRASTSFLFAHEMFTKLSSSSTEAHTSSAKTLSKNFGSLEDGEKRSLVGNSQEIAQKLHKYEDAGVEITELKFVYSDIQSLLSMMELFSSEVMPQFQHS